VAAAAPWYPQEMVDRPRQVVSAVLV